MSGDRDPGTYIGNQGWDGVRGDVQVGTHNGKLSPEAKERRRIKNLRNRSKVR